MGADKPTTRVLLVVDRSGSMSRHADVVRSGLNEYVQSLRDDKDIRYRVTVALFGSELKFVCRGEKPKNVPKFDEAMYYCQGMTALHYAIGATLDDHDKQPATKEALLRQEKTVLVVQTDGAENHSHYYSDPDSPANAPLALYDSDKIKAMIKEREERGWTCVYLGAGPAAWSGGHEFGHRVETQGTASSHVNTYSGLSGFTRKMSRGMEPQAAVKELADEANKDDK